MFGSSVRCFRGVAASRRGARSFFASGSGAANNGAWRKLNHVQAGGPWPMRGFCFHAGRARQRFSAATKESPASNWESQENPQELEEEAPAEEQLELPQPEASVSVEAVFLARAVDLKSLASEKSLDATVGRNHLIVKLKEEDNEALQLQDSNGAPTLDCWKRDRFMVVFNYGTVVMFNFGCPGRENDQSQWLERIKKHCKGVFDEATKDNYCVVVKPGLPKWSEGSVDRIMVKELDADSMKIVAVILSQSIALDHYTKNIDAMLKSFDDLNSNMQLTGTFNLKRKELFKLVASVNTALAEAILKVGLLERSDVAWQNANYDSIWAFMREEFELEDRFESLEFKTGIIQHNVAFYLDILQNRRSDSLEWIIIALIAADMCVSLYAIFLRT